MKLKEFNATSLPKIMGGGNQPAKIGFSKNGVVSINSKACELMEIKPGDKVAVAQDEKDEANWYFYKSDNGFEVRLGYDKKGCLFNHAALVDNFINTIGFDTNVSNNFIIAGKPTTVKNDKTKYWGILIIPKN